MAWDEQVQVAGLAGELGSLLGLGSWAAHFTSLCLSYPD